jgi:hypothetical protein
MKSFNTFISSTLKEAANNYKKVIIYPGRFQLPHKGHKFVYDYLEKKFNSNVYIATSNVVEKPKSPFSFIEKQALLEFCGIAKKFIVNVKNPYLAEEILSKYDKNKTIAIFGVGEKDFDRFPFGQKKDGTLRYFQEYDKFKNDLKPIKDHAYIIIVPTHTFKVSGKNSTSASQMRQMFSDFNDKEKEKEFIEDLYGKYSEKIHNLLSSKLS